MKYIIKEADNYNSYLLFENNQFELCTSMEEIAIYIRGNYLQDKEEITFKVMSVEGAIESMGIKEEKQEQDILNGKLSNNGKTITLITEDEEDIVFELSDLVGTIQEKTENQGGTISQETSDQIDNLDIHTTSTNVNTSNDKKETVEVPYFSMGNELESYTKELDNLGILYKVEKGQNLDYDNNTVISVEHNGEKIEKGTTIKINDTSVCNGKFKRTDTKTINYKFFRNFYMDEPSIVIYKGGDIGPLG